MHANKYEVLLEHFIATLKKSGLSAPSILLGLSGGPDSVFLFHQLVPFHQKGMIKLSAAHLDHGWRSTSTNDARFCKELSAKHHIPFFQAHATDLHNQVAYNGSKEEYGRNLRRSFFGQVKEKDSIDFIALAHHQQDVEETFFIRLMRGSSLQGLIGMKAIEGHYIRPLLSIAKEEILAYLAKNQMSYCNDSSNESPEFLRNRIRIEVIPALERCDPRFHTKFHDTLLTLQKDDAFLDKLTLEAFHRVFNTSPQALENQQQVLGSCTILCTLDPVLQNRLLVMWLSYFGVPFVAHKGYLDEIMRFLDSPRGGAHIIGPSLTIRKKSNTFWLEKPVDKQ